jgi:hypothetical protein
VHYLNFFAVNPQTKQEAIDLAKGIASSITAKSPADVGLFVPFPFLETVQDVFGDKAVVGAEVSHSSWEKLWSVMTESWAQDCVTFILAFCLTPKSMVCSMTDGHSREEWCIYGRHLSSHVEEHGNYVGSSWTLGTQND